MSTRPCSPTREKCTSGRLNTVFKPLKNGRLPMHRDDFGRAFDGAHKKPTTPPLQLRTADTAAGTEGEETLCQG